MAARGHAAGAARRSEPRCAAPGCATNPDQGYCLTDRAAHDLGGRSRFSTGLCLSLVVIGLALESASDAARALGHRPRSPVRRAPPVRLSVEPRVSVARRRAGPPAQPAPAPPRLQDRHRLALVVGTLLRSGAATAALRAGRSARRRLRHRDGDQSLPALRGDRLVGAPRTSARAGRRHEHRPPSRRRRPARGDPEDLHRGLHPARTRTSSSLPAAPGPRSSDTPRRSSRGCPRRAEASPASPTLGCLAGIEPGATVLDLGCGAGTDLFIAAQMVGRTAARSAST